MSDVGYSCRDVGNVGNGMSEMSEMTCRMSDIYVGMSGMSEMKRGSVGNVGIAKCECRDRVGSRAFRDLCSHPWPETDRLTFRIFIRNGNERRFLDSTTVPVCYLISCYRI